MKLSTIYIHEFSTGIQAERTADGGWVSRGFTGEYINKTIDPIPTAVQNAIRNRDFAVAEGASSHDPAIIGREVQSGGEVWSAIAVVTRGRDDKGRSGSMYRYFICQGGGNLGHILAWLDSIRRQTKQIPIFDPFDVRYLGQPTPYQFNKSQTQINLQDAKFQPLLAMDTPMIFPVGQPCTPSVIHQLAIEKARQTGQPVAWAYKAEALEQPRSFVLIQPASEKAEQLLVRAIASAPQYTAPIAGEYDIKSAIKGLISRDTVKPEQVQAIETAIAQRVQESDWEVIFNGQGATQARTQGIYSPQMVRLMTLRAIVIPSFLLEFLEWMQKRGKQEDHYEVSQVFQSEIMKSIPQVSGNAPNLASRAGEGVRLIIPQLVDQPELLKSLIWLLGESQGLWQRKYSTQFISDIEDDFASIRAKANKTTNVTFKLMNSHGWEEISKTLVSHWQFRHNNPHVEYQSLADLFGKIGSPAIAAVFYQVGYGKVPKEIFDEISPDGELISNVYGLTVEKWVGLPEKLLLTLMKIGGEIVPVIVVIPMIIASLILGFLGGRTSMELSDGNTSAPPSPAPRSSYGTNQPKVSPSKPKDEKSISSSSPGTPEISTASSKVSLLPGITQDVVTKFENTMIVIEKEVVETLETELTPELAKKGAYNKVEVQSIIINQLELTLSVDTNSYKDAKKVSEIKDAKKVSEIDEETRTKWINAIHKYQSIWSPPAAGYVVSGRDTVKKIRENVKEEITRQYLK